MIDSSMFVAGVPVGTYAIGDVIPMGILKGPSQVRDGYGNAILKGIYTGTMTVDTIRVEVVVQNSNMIDPIINGPAELHSILGVDTYGTGFQTGHDCPLDINSTWNVCAKVVKAGTTTKAFGIYALIEVDYPSVGSVADPRAETGTPMSIELDKTVTVNAPGDIAAAAWNVFNVDMFKPGYRYLMEKLGGSFAASTGSYGFVAFNNAAGQNGLTRIVPFNADLNAVCAEITYSSVLTKGPMDVSFLVFGPNAGTDTIHLVTDYVKR